MLSRREFLVSGTIAATGIVFPSSAADAASANAFYEYKEQAEEAYAQRQNIPDRETVAAELHWYRPFLEKELSLLDMAWAHREAADEEAIIEVGQHRAQAPFELNVFYDIQDDQADIGRHLRKGKDAGLATLELYDGFDPQDIQATVHAVDDVAPLYWTATNAAGLLNYLTIPEVLQDVNDIYAIYARSRAIDGSYWGGNANAVFGALHILHPFLSDAEGTRFIHTAVDQYPDFLSNRNIRAEFVWLTYDNAGNRVGISNKQRLQEDIAYVRAAPIGDYPFSNRVAKQDTERLEQVMQRLMENDRE